MSDVGLFIAISVGLLVCLFLVLFIYRKAAYIKRVKQQQAEQKAVIESRLKERFIYLSDSLKLLSQAIKDDQVGVVEGAIRISVLLKEYDPDIFNNEDYAVFMRIANQTEHIPIKEAWKALDRKTKHKYEQFMDALAEKHGDEAKHAAMSLFEYMNQVRH